MSNLEWVVRWDPRSGAADLADLGSKKPRKRKERREADRRGNRGGTVADLGQPQDVRAGEQRKEGLENCRRT